MTARTVLLAMHDSAPGGAGVAALRAAAHLPEQGWQPAFWFPGPGRGPAMAEDSRLWAIDVLPALYLAYIVVRVKLLPYDLIGTDASPRAIYVAVGMGIIGYYFAAFARTSDRFPIAVVRSLLWSGLLVAFLALVDEATGWNLWNISEVGQDTQARRVVATFTSATALAAYIGASLVFATAILAFRGPRSLRLPAMLLIPVAVPAMFFTYTRGPVLGAAVVIVFIALIANRARWPSSCICDRRNPRVRCVGPNLVDRRLSRTTRRDGNRADS